MTDAEYESAVYRVDRKLAEGREVSPLRGDYREEPSEYSGGKEGGYAEINCPSCEYSIPAADLIYEGGRPCPGCGRNVRLHVTSHEMYGEMRNVPRERQEEYR